MVKSRPGTQINVDFSPSISTAAMVVDELEPVEVKPRQNYIRCNLGGPRKQCSRNTSVPKHTFDRPSTAKQLLTHCFAVCLFQKRFC